MCAQSSKNVVKLTNTLLQILLIIKYGLLIPPRNKTTLCQWKSPCSQRRKNPKVWINIKSMLKVEHYLDKALYTKNLLHRTRRWMGSSTIMFWGGFKNKLDRNAWGIDQAITGIALWCASLFITHCMSVFNCYEHDYHSLSPLLSWPSPLQFLCSKKWK